MRIIRIILILIFFTPSVVWGQGETPNTEAGDGCLIEGECLEQSVEDCVPCDLSAPETLPIGDFLNEKPEEEKKPEDVSVVVKAAAGLNKMNIGAPSDLMARAINAMIAFMGSIAIVLYIYGGFVWMSASGNAEKTSKARSILVWTTLGALAMGASYMVIRTILERIG